MKDMILFPEDIDRLNVVLEQLTVKANLLLAVLINKDGRLLTYQGSLEKIDTVSMAALVAGNSASTLAIANLMGETEFSAMYHQGKDRHIFIAVVDENTFLCLVFDERTNIDRVKVFARQFDRQIKKALIQVYDKTEEQVDLDLDMNSFSSSPAQTPPTSEYQNQQQQHAYQPSTKNHTPPSINKPESTGDHLNILPHDSINKNQSAGLIEVEDEVFFTERHSDAASSELLGEEVHDTNYLYLKKKIRETVQRKKEQQ
jgi:predicted regulator of Ras-like GTPase activity (Roadblock/LC7/MglB family)